MYKPPWTYSSLKTILGRPNSSKWPIIALKKPFWGGPILVNGPSLISVKRQKPGVFVQTAQMERTNRGATPTKDGRWRRQQTTRKRSWRRRGNLKPTLPPSWERILRARSSHGYIYVYSEFQNNFFSHFFCIWYNLANMKCKLNLSV